MKTIKINCGSAKDPDPLDPQDFGFLDPDPKNMRIHGSGPSGKILAKNCKINFFTPKSRIWIFEKWEIIKVSSFLNG